MERINYRITLDTHKTGIQRTLQGFETADKLSRSISVNLTASGDTYEIPLDNVVAMMYVTTPGASEPSINECRIEDNTIVYDVLPIVEEGITEMQLKLSETSVDGAKRVLIAPRFAVEVTESGTDDDEAEQSTTFTALEAAIAKAQGVYDSRLLRVEIGDDCVFRAYFADGTVYENHALHEALYNGNALLSESWAKGGTGMRENEDTNNSMYFSNVSRSSAIDASESVDVARGLVNMAKLYSTYTSFSTNFETGELEYISASNNFDIDEATGELMVEGETFDPGDIVEKSVEEYLETQTAEINAHLANKNNPHGVTAAQVGASPSNHTHTASEVGARPSTWMPTAAQVGASPSNHTHTASEVGARPSTWMPTAAQVGASPSNHTHTASEVGASPSDHTHTELSYMTGLTGDVQTQLNAKAEFDDNQIAQFYSLSRIGLTDSDFVSDDLATNLNTIMDAAAATFEPSYRIWEFSCVYESTHPLVASMNAAINSQFGSTWNTYIDFWMQKISPLHMRVYIYLQGDSAYRYAYYLSYRKSDNTYHLQAISGHRTQPSGTYVGNGSSTSRTISIGTNSGNSCSIWSDNGTVFVNKAGGIAKSGTSTKGFAATAVSINNGKITIASSDALLNTSGVTYYYEII